jgi:NDP-sugar pyrophosphorylase family protein
MSWVTTFPFGGVKWPLEQELPSYRLSKGDVKIGNDVWIGDHAVILSGVTIGNGAIIGANAVVARDVAAYAVVVGNPAREVRKRFDERSIQRLEALKWWDWPNERIARFAALMLSPDISRFLDAAEQETGVAGRSVGTGAEPISY